MKIFKSIISRFLIGSILLAGIFYYLIATQSGLEVIARIATKVLPGKIQYTQLQGTLSKEITIANLSYENDGTNFSVKSFHLQWDLTDFLNKITIRNLSAQDVIVTTTPSKNKGKTKPDLKGLAYFDIQHADIINLTVNKTHIPHLSIQENTAGQHNVLIESNMGKITGEYSLQLEPVLRWDAKLMVSGINPAVFSSQLKGDLNISVATQGEWSHHKDEVNLQVDKFEGKLGDYSVNGVAKLNYLNGELSIQTAQLKTGDAISNITGSVKDDWNLKWQIAIPDLSIFIPDTQGTFTSTGNLTGPKLSPNVHANVKLGNLPEVEDIHANVDGNINIDPNTQAYATNLKLTRMAVNAPKLGLNIASMTISLLNKMNAPLQFSGDFNAGSGKGTLVGSIDLNQTPIAAQLKLSGTNLQAVNLDEYKITVTPDLNITYKNNQVSAVGTINIPSAQITPTNFDNVVTLPSETVFISDDKDTKDIANIPPNIALQIKLTLGDHIHIAYDNLTADLKGNLEINQAPGSLATATGELSTSNGVYQAYGKKLEIQTGRLIYTGNALTNPGLNISASKKITTIAFNGSSAFSNNSNFQPSYNGNQTINVGVSVKGTLEKPVINFFSDSGLSQDDILSYLVFGYPRSQVTTESGISLLNSIALNSKTGTNSTGLGDVTNKIQKTLGLSEFGVGSTEAYDPTTNSVNNTTTFNLGKRIGKKLYLHYSVGIFSNFQTLNLRYQITKHLSVQSATSTLGNGAVDNGADVFYQFER